MGVPQIHRNREHAGADEPEGSRLLDSSARRNVDGGAANGRKGRIDQIYRGRGPLERIHVAICPVS